MLQGFSLVQKGLFQPNMSRQPRDFGNPVHFTHHDSFFSVYYFGVFCDADGASEI